MTQVRIVMAALDRFTEGVMADLTLEATANLSSPPPEGTPIDTGWARNNWVPAIGAPLEAPVATPETTSPGAQRGALAQVAARYRLAQGPIFISNNVPYIGRLNDGHSQQSPAGFIQAAITRAIRTVATIPRAS